MTGYVLAAAPVVAGVGMYALNPAYMRVLVDEPGGRLMLAVAVTLQIFGFLVIRRMVDVKF
jgi:tight adherence protein B